MSPEQRERYDALARIVHAARGKKATLEAIGKVVFGKPAKSTVSNLAKRGQELAEDPRHEWPDLN